VAFSSAGRYTKTASPGNHNRITMNTTNKTEATGGLDARWFALANDITFLSPDSRVKARVIKAQTGIPQGHVLVRDYDSPNDTLIDDDEIVDLKGGNVFFSLERNHCRSGTPTGQPKLAWLVDDRPELTVLPNQTGQSLLDLFGLPIGSPLFRDYESPLDQPIQAGDALVFGDGPVFYTRSRVCELTEITIFVNTEPKKVRQTHITYEEVLRLAFETPPVGTDVHFTVDYRKGPPENPSGVLVEGSKQIKLKEGMRFDVTANDRS